MVIACGVWSPRIARMAGATIPLTPAVHQMIDVGPIPILQESGKELAFPIVRDMDTFMYERQTSGSMEVGSYAHRPIFHSPDEIPSISEARISPTELPFTADDFDDQLEDALELMPEILSGAEIKYSINGLLSLTPDAMPLIGETVEVSNLWSAAAIWIKEGPGTGTGGSGVDDHTATPSSIPTPQTSPVSTPTPAPSITCAPAAPSISTRPTGSFTPVSNGPRSVTSACRRFIPGPVISVRSTSRPVVGSGLTGMNRMRPWSIITASKTAPTSGIAAGGRRSRAPSTWPCGKRVGMVDLAPFVIFDFTGPGVVDYIQHMAVNNADVEVGRSVYTPLLTESGGFKADLTILRLGDEHFRVITGAFDGPRDKHWFRRLLPDDGSVHMADFTSAYTTIGVWGPGSARPGPVDHRPRPLQRGLSLRHDPGGRLRLDKRPAVPHLLCRGVGVGGVRAVRGRPTDVGPALGGRPGSRV